MLNLFIIIHNEGCSLFMVPSQTEINLFPPQTSDFREQEKCCLAKRVTAKFRAYKAPIEREVWCLKFPLFMANSTHWG